MEIKVLNQKEVEKFLENLKKAKLEKSKKALFNAGFFIQNEVKASIAGQRSEPTSVDTGRFLNSVDVKQGKTDDEVIVFTNIEYAKYLEYGTSKIQPRAHFGNTAKRVNKEVKKIVAQEIK